MRLNKIEGEFKMMSSQMAISMLKELNRAEKELKESEKREEKITKEFMESIKRLSLLI